MKTCPGCGDGFVGFEKFCSVCRRTGVAKAHDKLGPEITASDIDRRFAEQSGPKNSLVEALVDSTLETLTDAALCPTCGQKVRTAMSNAERQRRYRERKRAKL